MGYSEFKPSRHYVVGVYIVIIVSIYFFYKYNDKFHIVENSKHNVYINEESNVTGASVEMVEGRIENLSRRAKVDTIRAAIKTDRNQEILVIDTEEGHFELDIYTMKNHDMDLGIPIKDDSAYPKVIVSSMSKLTTGGIILETTQTLGTDTYANRVYIRENQIINSGFQIRTGIKENTVYYDNVVLIINTLNKTSGNVMSVYDDTTGELLFSLDAKEAPVLKQSKFALICSAVGNNFIAFSGMYTDSGTENFINFSDNRKQIKSAWNYVKAEEKQIRNLKAYEKETMGECLVFERRNADNELIYNINYPAETAVHDMVIIPLDINETPIENQRTPIDEM